MQSSGFTNVPDGGRGAALRRDQRRGGRLQDRRDPIGGQGAGPVRPVAPAACRRRRVWANGRGDFTSEMSS